ncbi:hypothetical protein DFP72DRAFT_1069040 [Ephemerocybe angulata]|uniref:Uncharacterized protein n=1 Tax=Ephemerocybe angulata TaxID=980116 RepID=A0A8H6HVX5_9AGAR|nr:hypothetical protein DFP72DRAFT_1069040 [Tulosesus angulatus]
MGRPRLYNTAEEIAEANRIKSTKYYAKNRKRILRKRARAKEASNPQNTMHEVSTTPKPLQRTAEEEHQWQLKYWSKQVEGVPKRIMVILGDKTTEDFLTGVCEEFKTTRKADLVKAKDDINQHIVDLNKVYDKLTKYHGALLNLVGSWADEFKRASAIMSDIRIVVNELNELLCAAMVDPDELIVDFDSHALPFQAKGVSVSTF